MISQTVFDTSEVLALKGIQHVVLSPGSRNAPLTISFARNPKIKSYNVVDERSAGFIALGMAQKLKSPVVLCCTSGTSLLNYAPAVAEAYYQQIPLIIISADRPPEWHEQREGQTIHQLGAIANFVKKTFQLPAESSKDIDAWEYNRKLNEAVNLSVTGVKGPVHINIPFREPFYPKADDILEYSMNPRVIEPVRFLSEVDYKELITEYFNFDKKLIIGGQHELDFELTELLGQIDDVTVVADVISNLKNKHFVFHQDLFLAGIEDDLAESLRPDLLITFGKSVISKNLKLFIRKFPPLQHWHFDEGLLHADTFQSITKLIGSDFKTFLSQLNQIDQEASVFQLQKSKNYRQNWKVQDDQVSRKLPLSISESPFCEFQAFKEVISLIPDNADIHLANSMPVRFANFIQNLKPNQEVFCNRGTSGIDGTNGTSVGHAMVSDKPVWLLTGDLSFFYDRNCFFHQHAFNQLKIVVFNNSGGGIFRLIPGPSSQPELVQHFETRHSHSAKFTALEYGFDYHVAKDVEGIQKAMQSLGQDVKSTKLLEVFTDPEVNSREYQRIKNKLK
jgi:2-succinyl-5-enolpyruvyl-6-hydroxy-3-cyclohexene-1-carboxylate synthase